MNQAFSLSNRTLNRRRLLAIPGAALVGAAAGGALATGVQAGTANLPPAVQARLVPAMREAIVEARQAAYAFGSVLLDVSSGSTVFRGHNTTASGDPSAHAELGVMRAAGLAGIDLTKTVLVTTAECCSMCATCAVWAGVAGVAYGTSIPSVLKFGWQQPNIRLQEVVDRAGFNQMPVVGGILSEETDVLYSAGPPA